MQAKLVQVDDLKPGDILGQDIMQGSQVLLRSGLKLQLQQIERIKRTGLRNVNILVAESKAEIAAVEQAVEPVARPPAGKKPSLPSLLRREIDEGSENWMSTVEFNQPVPVPDNMTQAEQILAAAKVELRNAAGLKPLIPEEENERLQVNLHTTLVSSAVKGQVDLDRLAMVAKDLSTVLEDNPEGYLSFADVPKYGQTLAARGLMSSKVFSLVRDESNDINLEEAIRAQFALVSMYSLLPAEMSCRLRMLNADEKRQIQHALMEYYGWLRSQRYVNEKLLELILLQYERHDGHGLPYGLANEAIPPESNILALSWGYSCQLYSTPEIPRVTASHAAHDLVRSSGTAFSSREVNRFLRRMGYYPNGSLLELNDGRLAIVVRQNEIALLKPVVRIINADGEVAEEVDLRSTSDTFVKQQIIEY